MNVNDSHISPFLLQKSQLFIKRFVTFWSDKSKSLFLFHSTGSGKTCSAVLGAEMYIDYLQKHDVPNGRVIIISNKISRELFVKNIIGQCGNIANNKSYIDNNKYITKKEIENINKYSEIYDKKTFRKMRKKLITNKLESVGYRFYSYQIFGRDTIYKKIKNFDNSLIIIDEAHSLLNDNKFNQAFNNIKEKSKNYKMLLLSATPMINKPYDIVDFINIMYKKNQMIKHTSIFNSDNSLKHEYLDVLIDKLKGKVSYVNIYDPINYPKRIDMGIVPKNLLKYTKVIRVPLNPLQYRAYTKEHKMNVKINIDKIFNFVFPVGNEYYYNVNDLYRVSNHPDMKGVHFIYSGGSKIITGDFLHISKLKKYSSKYHKCLSDIISTPVGNTMIFSKFVSNTGIKFFGEIMRVNGFDEYGTKSILRENSRHYLTHETYANWKKRKRDPSSPVFISAKYIVFYDSISIDNRNKFIAVFNSKENYQGKLIKYFLGSQLIKESVDLKRIIHVRILEFQNNFSRIEQIIGRAIRFKSHQDIEKVTYIHKYVSALPTNVRKKILHNNGKKEKIYNISEFDKCPWTVEELEYRRDEMDHVIIKQIERDIKMIAINCNRNHNIFSEKEFKNKRECDYMSCKYKCIFDDINFKNIYGKKNNFIYDIFYYDLEIAHIKDIIRKIYYDAIIYEKSELIYQIKKISPSIDDKFIELALHDIVGNHTDKIIMGNTKPQIRLSKPLTIRNKYGSIGYIQYINNHYIFHPNNINESMFLSINMRGPGSIHQPKIKINVNDIISDILIDEKKDLSKIKIKVSLNKLLKDISTMTTEFKIFKYINSLTLSSKKLLLEKAIILHSKKSYKINPVIFNILKFFKFYLINSDSRRKNTELYNDNHDSYFDRKYITSVSNKSTSIRKTKQIIGHILGGHPSKMTTNDKFVLDKTLKHRKSLPENKFIVGISKYHYNNHNLIFKLKYSSIPEKSVIDKRLVKKGFKCVQINNKVEIKKIYNTLLEGEKRDKSSYEIPNEKLGKTKIITYCRYIERLIRKKQFDNPGVRWFYDTK